MDGYTDRQQGDLISLLSFFQNNGSRLIITMTTIIIAIIKSKLRTVRNIPSPWGRLTTETVRINLM
jgi:hypothetical protein